MSDDVDIPDAGDERLVEQLTSDRPTPSPALRRRVRHRVDGALHRVALRRRSLGLVSAGTLLLLAAVVLALSVPR